MSGITIASRWMHNAFMSNSASQNELSKGRDKGAWWLGHPWSVESEMQVVSQCIFCSGIMASGASSLFPSGAKTCLFTDLECLVEAGWIGVSFGYIWVECRLSQGRGIPRCGVPISQLSQWGSTAGLFEGRVTQQQQHRSRSCASVCRTRLPAF